MTLLLISLSTIVLTTLLCICAIFKFLAPTDGIRRWVREKLARLAEFWIGVNKFILSFYKNPDWDIELPDGLDVKGCYLVSCNHQSWVDILVLQQVFNRRIPFMRFFIKSQLFWVPFLGIAWWALDMPFMKRDSKQVLAKNPSRKGRDLENARRACEKFRDMPVSIMNFTEGTRFSVEKRDSKDLPYRNLLMPRIGGVGQVFYALADQLDSLLDVTIVYPEEKEQGRAPTFWQFICGQVPRIIVRCREIKIPEHLLGRNFRTDRKFRRDLEEWISDIWMEKDRLISQLTAG